MSEVFRLRERRFLGEDVEFVATDERSLSGGLRAPQAAHRLTRSSLISVHEEHVQAVDSCCSSDSISVLDGSEALVAGGFGPLCFCKVAVSCSLAVVASFESFGTGECACRRFFFRASFNCIRIVLCGFAILLSTSKR